MPAFSLPSSVLVRVPVVETTLPVAALPSIVPVTVEPASVSNVTVTVSPDFASDVSELFDAIEMLVGTVGAVTSAAALSTTPTTA